MGKVIVIPIFLGGVMYLLYSWVLEQKKQYRKVEELIVFLQKSVFAMEEEKIRIIDYLQNYSTREPLLQETLQEISRRLEKNVFPSGENVWEETFREKKALWNLEAETFEIVLGLGMGFFGKKRSENVSFLKRGLKSLEQRLKITKEKDAKERKVWIPVSMLGGIMLMIILV